MKTISLDPVTPPLLLAGHLSFVTVDHPPPHWCVECHLYENETHGIGGTDDHEPVYESPWIGQRVAIHAAKWNYPRLLSAIAGEEVQCDAIVGSGTLAEALLIHSPEFMAPNGPYVSVTENELIVVHTGKYADGWTNISDQLPLQDWTPGRWALRFTDVAPTSERCAQCWVRHDMAHAGTHVLAPVLSGDGTYREWTP